MNTTIAMPRYRCHKEVGAVKIGEGIEVLEDGSVKLPIASGEVAGLESVTVAKDVVARYMPLPGDYLVEYEDGYRSVSPGRVFESGYTRIEPGAGEVLGGCVANEKSAG